MLTQVDTFIKNIEKKDKIINYLKSIYKIEVGEEAVIPDVYIEGDEEAKKEEVNFGSESSEHFASFEEKIDSLNLPSVNDKNIKLKIAKLKKAKDTKFLIKHLNLSGYAYKGFSLDLFKRVVEGLKIFKSVEDINLRKNNLDDSYAEQICELFNIEGLKRIDLSYNHFHKGAAKKFTNAVKNSSKLEYLDLTHNPFNQDEYSCANICTALKSHPNLFHFGLSDSSRDSALRVLQFKPDLRSLNLEDSRYKHKAFEYFTKFLVDKKYTLAVLSLKYCTIDLFSANHLEKSLRVNKTLVYLNLYSSGLSDIAATRIISALEMNRTLIDLDLGANKLGEIFCHKVNKLLKVNNILNRLNISKNYLITSDDFSLILEGLVNNQSIISLGDLSDMKIGVKIRESAEIILDLNRKYIDGGKINELNGTNTLNSLTEFNKSQKMNFFKSSVDFEGQEKLKRESLDYNSHEGIYSDYAGIMNKYDIKLIPEEDNFNFFIY